MTYNQNRRSIGVTVRSQRCVSLLLTWGEDYISWCSSHVQCSYRNRPPDRPDHTCGRSPTSETSLYWTGKSCELCPQCSGSPSVQGSAKSSGWTHRGRCCPTFSASSERTETVSVVPVWLSQTYWPSLFASLPCRAVTVEVQSLASTQRGKIDLR